MIAEFFSEQIDPALILCVLLHADFNRNIVAGKDVEIVELFAVYLLDRKSVV